jgi:hypothetical protein
MQHMQLFDPIVYKTSYTRLTFTYNNMYVDNICNMNLYFIHLYYSIGFGHGDTCSFVKVNYMGHMVFKHYWNIHHY